MSKKKKVDLAIDTTVMAIREELMCYFKGTCIERMTTSQMVGVVGHSSYNESRYYYQRREREIVGAASLVIGHERLFELGHEPEKITFTKALNRSPQLWEMTEKVEKFLIRYLPNVRIEKPKYKGVGKADDSHLMLGTELRDNTVSDMQREYERMIARLEIRPAATYSRGTAIAMNEAWTTTASSYGIDIADMTMTSLTNMDF